MKQHNNDIEVLIAKSLTKEANQDEIIQLNSWIAESEENGKYYDSLVKTWTLTNSEAQFDTDKAWNNVKEAAQIKKPKTATLYKAFQYAAILIVGGVCLFYINRTNNTIPTDNPVAQTLLFKTDTVKELILTDGSIITSRKDTRISYPEFFDSTREIKLEGRAFFSIENDEDKPFIINTESGYIQVVGTEFYVDSKKPSGLLIQVTSGKVKVAKTKKELKSTHFILTAGEFIILNDSAVVQKVKSKNILSWRTKKLKFKKVPLSKVVKELSSTYDILISLDNKQLENCELTARYNNKSLKHILSNIAETFNLEIIELDSGFKLQGDGC